MNKDELISVISHASDQYGDKLLEFMNRYNLTSLTEAKPEQLKKFIKQEDLQK